MANWWL